jgi:hypothetical protein
MTSGIPTFNDVLHYFELSLNICEGLRPKVVSNQLNLDGYSKTNTRKELFEFFNTGVYMQIIIAKYLYRVGNLKKKLFINI